MARVKILKPGETDINSTDAWRFMFDSNFPTWKVFDQDSDPLTLAAGDTFEEKIITHNLGYIPYARPSATLNGVTYKVSALTFTGQNVAGFHPGFGSDNYEVGFTARVTTTQLRIGIFLADGFADPDSAINSTVEWIINLDEQ